MRLQRDKKCLVNEVVSAHRSRKEAIMSQKNARINESVTNEKEMSNIHNEYCNRYSSGGAVYSAISQAKSENYLHMATQRHTSVHGSYGRFLGQVKREATHGKKVLSENGALEYASTGSFLTDFNARATELRNAHEFVIMDAAMRAYAEDPVAFVKLLFQTGDIRGGKGERHIFNVGMDWLTMTHPLVAAEVLALIPDYTRWDYLVRQTISESKVVSESATAIVVEQFHNDLEAVRNAKDGECVRISLLAKWMPSLQTKKPADKKVVRHLLRSLHMQERQYRKALSELRAHLNVIEKAMSIKDYDAIDMEKLSAKQQLRYAAFFKRVLSEKRHEYIQAVLRGEMKMNASVLNPLEILHEYIKANHKIIQYNEDYEALWSLLPDRMSGNGKTLVIRDGSSSMTRRIGQGSNASMLEASTAMAIYCAEHMSGAFKDTVLTFSSRPEVVDLSGCRTLADKISLLYNYADCSNTDLEATFDLILSAAVKDNLAQEELPSYLMILSDMEFDEARGDYGWFIDEWEEVQESVDKDTLFDTIRKKWNAAGYEMPMLVFWQLNGRRSIYPEIDAKNGIIYLSGFSTNELELVMAGQYESVEEIEEEVQVVDVATGETETIVQTRTERVIMSPKQQLAVKLSDPRYDMVEEAVQRGLEKESA